MPLGSKIDRVGLRRESELQACLRRYRNDSLIAWHLDMSVEEVRAARARYRPQREVGSYLKNSGNLGTEEYDGRRKAAARSNAQYLAAIARCGD